MGNSNNTDPLADVLRGIRKTDDYRDAASKIITILKLKQRDLNDFKLKVLLIKATMLLWGTTKEADMVLMAFGLLDGYYYDTEYIKGALAKEARRIGARRTKYLQCGPYLRTKEGSQYESFEAIPTKDEQKAARNALGVQDGRLINKLAEKIREIPNIREYVKTAEDDPDFPYARIRYTKTGRKIYIIELPKQCCFLEDFPLPEEPTVTPETANMDEVQEPIADEPESPANPTEIAINTEVSQSTVAVAPLAHGWGDNGGLRPSYTLQQIQGGILGDTIVFNSISNGVIGDEKKFVGAREDIGSYEGINNSWHSNYITVEDGKTYIIRLYVHNNNPNGWQAVAKDVRAAFNLPTESGRQIRVTGYIRSSNATPGEYWANVVFCSETAKFHLEYVWGSARLENRGLGRQPSIKASDDVVTRASTGGILVDYDTLDGSVPGSFQCASYIFIRVKAVFDFDFDFRVEQRVRIAGTSDWKTHVDAKVGDMIEFRIQYKNTSTKTHYNVTIKDILPKNMRYVSGAAKLTNTKGTQEIGEDSLTTTGISIGDYMPGANALVDFTAEVIDIDLRNGPNTLVNWSQCGVGRVTLQDHATVQLIIDK